MPIAPHRRHVPGSAPTQRGPSAALRVAGGLEGMIALDVVIAMPPIREDHHCFQNIRTSRAVDLARYAA